MHAGTITWNGLDLSGLGKPRILISQQADPPAPAAPTRMLTTLKVTVELEAMDPGTIQARMERLQQAMTAPEGILTSACGSGHGMSWMAVPAGNNLQAALTGTTNSIELSFQAVEAHAPGALTAIPGASITPAGSDTPILLHAVRDQKEDVAEERHSQRASARRVTTHTLSFTARVAQADPTASHAERLAWLQAQADAVKALDCREGTLVFGALNKIVRVTDFAPMIDDGRGVLDLRIQCFYTVMPDAEKAEAGLEIRTRDDAGSGEKVISITGTIEAETRDIALAKLNAIRENQVTTGRRATMFETQEKAIDGADTDGIPGADWTGALNFTLELREPREGSHYSLKITTQRDIRSGMRWNYSGSVMAANESAALATARGLVAATGHPVKTRSEESIERATDLSGGSARFVKLDFSYEFEGPSDGFIGGEISTDRALPLFGEWRRMINGFLVAASRSIAETRLTALLAGEGQAIEKTIKWSETYLDATGSGAGGTVFQKLEFSAGRREIRSQASAKYTDNTSDDAGTLVRQREVSGSIWTSTSANAETVLEELITALFGAGANRPQRIQKTHHQERWGNASTIDSTAANSAWAQLDFQLGKTSRMTGEIGHDIIDASYTVERISSIQATAITIIAYGRPVAQPNTGWLPGKVTLNGTCKARVAATAIAWVQGKRTLIATTGSAGITRHETEQPRENLAAEHAPFSGTDVTTYTFTATYGWTFTGSVLDGLWPDAFGV